MHSGIPDREFCYRLKAHLSKTVPVKETPERLYGDDSDDDWHQQWWWENGDDDNDNE